MTSDPHPLCNHDAGLCALNDPDNAEAHANLAATVAALDEEHFRMFPELMGIDEVAARTAGADWCDTIRTTLVGDERTEAHGTGNYLLSDVLMLPHLEEHGLAGTRRAPEVVAALVWYSIGVAAATAPFDDLRLTPAEITNPRNREHAATLLTMAAHLLRHGPNVPEADQFPGMLGSALPPMTHPAPLAHRPLFNRYKLNAALKALGVGLRAEVLTNRPNLSAMEAPELTGILVGVLMHTLYGIDPQTQSVDFTRAFHGWSASFVADRDDNPRAFADAVAAALALTSMWTGHMLSEGADARANLRLGFNARPGTLMLAAHTATAAGQLAASVADGGQTRPGYSYAEVAKNLRDYADMLDRLSITHGPASTPENHQ